MPTPSTAAPAPLHAEGRGLVVGISDSEVVETDIDGCVALYLASGPVAVVLNSTASDIWRRIRRGTALEDLAPALALDYGVEAVAIVPEVDYLVVRLRDLGLIETRPS